MGLSFPSLGIAYSRASVLGSCSRASGLRIPEPRCSGIGVHSTYRAQSQYTSICILCTNILVYLVYLTLALQIECAPCAQSAAQASVLASAVQTFLLTHTVAAHLLLHTEYAGSPGDAYMTSFVLNVVIFAYQIPSTSSSFVIWPKICCPSVLVANTSHDRVVRFMPL